MDLFLDKLNSEQTFFNIQCSRAFIGFSYIKLSPTSTGTQFGSAIASTYMYLYVNLALKAWKCL